MIVPFAGPGLLACESTRIGGGSTGPFASMNLGLFTTDIPDQVEANLRDHCQSLGIPVNQLAISRQVHGAEVLNVKTPGRYEGFDALVTDRQDIYLGISTADCCPILLYDPERQAVGAVHAGWRGAASSILPKTIDQMILAFGCRPEHILTYLGTCIGPMSYEVGEEVADQFPDVFLRPGPTEGKYYLDLKGCLFAQALAAGILAEHIGASHHTTYDEPELFFSYRRDGVTSGRMLSLIGMRSQA